MNKEIDSILQKANELQTKIKEVKYFNRHILGGNTSWQNGGGQYMVNCFLKKETTTKVSMLGWLLHGFNDEQKIRIPNCVLDAIQEVTFKYQTNLESQLAELLRGGENG